MTEPIVETVVDCTTRVETVRELSAEDLADVKLRAAESAARESATADAEARRQQAIGIVEDKARTDPAFAALLTLLGVSTGATS